MPCAYLTNTALIIPSREKGLISSLIQYYSLVQEYRRRGFQNRWVTKRIPVALYTWSEKGDLVIPRGLLFSLPPQASIDIIDQSSHDLDVKEIPSSEEIEGILPGITLRIDQILAVRKALAAKRGILQMSAGAGKTEVMASILKFLGGLFGYESIKSLIIEPTLVLAQSTLNRLNKYGVPASFYGDSRDFNAAGPIVISHPASLHNDLRENPRLLEPTKILIFDESHHLIAHTWKSLLAATPNLEYSLGLSALVVDPKRVTARDIRCFTVDEAVAMGCSGPVIHMVNTDYYVDKGILATPVLIQLDHKALEQLPCRSRAESSWSDYQKYKLESTARNDLVVRMALFLAHFNRKVLILVNTKRHAYALLRQFADRGENSVRTSFGDFQFNKYDPAKDRVVEAEPDTLTRFVNGEFKILIATTHLDEGVDIPYLDAAILAGGGKKDRRLIQRIGRMLRKTKSGKYGYIIDFSDSGDPVLGRHANLRLRTYREVIGLDPSRSYLRVSFEQAKAIFDSLERG